MTAKIYAINDVPFKAMQGLLSRIYSKEVMDVKRSKCSIAPDAVEIICIEDVNQLAGYAVLYKNPHLFIKEGICSFGNIEFIDEFEVSQLLFTTIAERAKTYGATSIVGPMNGSTWYDYRLTLRSDHPLFLTENIHPDYYVTHMKQNGFHSIAQFYSAEDSTKYEATKKHEKSHRFFEEKGFKLRNLSPDSFEEDLPRIHTLCNEAFASNFLFAPIELEQFLQLYLPIKQMINYQYSKIVEFQNKVVAVILVIPNLLSESKEPIIKTVARHPDKMYQGLGSFLTSDYKYNSTKNTDVNCIHAFMHSGNESTLISNKFRGEIIRNYSLFSKQLK